MSGRKKGKSDEERIQEAVEKALRLLDTQLVATASKLGSPKIRPQVIQQLAAQGYEKAGKAVRVPLAEQGKRLLASGSYLPYDKLHKHLAGTTATEAKRWAKKLCDQGHADLVLRGKQLSLIPKGQAVADRADLQSIITETKGVLDWLKKARASRQGATVLEGDLGEAFNELGELVERARRDWREGVARSAETRGESQSLAARLRGVILAERDEETQLARVPQVSRRLRQWASESEVRQELLAAHQRGELELRPEGGFARLSEEDLALCPRGAGGIALSWARLQEV